MDLLESVENVTQIGFGTWNKKAPLNSTEVWVWFSGSDKELKKKLSSRLRETTVTLGKDAISEFHSSKTTVFVVRPDLAEGESATASHNERFVKSAYAKARDAVGQWRRIHGKGKEKVLLRFFGGDEHARLGALVGWLVASYQFLGVVKNVKIKPTVFIKDEDKALTKETIAKAEALAAGINLARHLTNLPADTLNPDNYAKICRSTFSREKVVQVKVLEPKELRKEKLNLLLGVGQGSQHGARLVHLKYRPRGNNKAPLAFVGKGITFDTGGLDLKPSSGMRLMKKDMAGSAVLLGLCYYLSKTKLNVPCDFYLAIAENAVSDRSTKPGDVHHSKSGLLVEIDNTDAEGRLVMADAISYALAKTGKDKPRHLIDVSTLTGAMRVAVGLDIAGYFSNDDALSARLEIASKNSGESVWRMPLYQKYKSQLKSDFADIKNSSDSSFGGAINAALFLHRFVQDQSWAHFDMMAWNMSADGALGVGANAQTLQVLAHFLVEEE